MTGGHSHDWKRHPVQTGKRRSTGAVQNASVTCVTNLRRRFGVRRCCAAFSMSADKSRRGGSPSAILPSRLRRRRCARLRRRMVESSGRRVSRERRPSGRSLISHHSRWKSDDRHNRALRCRKHLLPRCPCRPRAVRLHLARHVVDWWD
jgi:hypothetical protein